MFEEAAIPHAAERRHFVKAGAAAGLARERGIGADLAVEHDVGTGRTTKST